MKRDRAFWKRKTAKTSYKRKIGARVVHICVFVVGVKITLNYYTHSTGIQGVSKKRCKNKPRCVLVVVVKCYEQ